MKLSHVLTIATMIMAILTPSHRLALGDDNCAAAAIDRFITRGLDEWNVTGMAVAVVKDGRVVFLRGYGVRDIRTGQPVDQNTVFQIGSCTKPLTATLAAKLVSDGELEWDANVKDLWPEFQTSNEEVTERATLRDLLSHRTGIGKEEAALYYEMPISRDELLAQLPHIQQAAAFRKEWRYSGLMYTIAGRAAESATGSRWDDLMRQRLFRPLGMTRTVASSAALRDMDNVAVPHVLTADGVRAGSFADQDAIGPAASVCSSASDLSKWLLLITQRGTVNGRELIRREDVDELTRPQIAMPFSDPVLGEYDTKNYGLGFMVFDYHGRSLALHPGMSGHSMGIVGFVPKDGVGVAVLTNYRPSLFHYAVFRRAIDLYCGEEPLDLDASNRKLFDDHLARQTESLKRRAATRDPNAKPTLDLRDYAGAYERDYGLRATLSMESGKLILRYGNFVADVEPWSGDTFQARLREPRLPAEQHWYLTFTIEEERIAKLHIESEHDVDSEFTPLPTKATAPQKPAVP